jgi:glycosyltransferase involved in cell wall biosynthesis
VLAVTNMYPPHHYGGYELVCQEVIDLLRRRGHEVLVLTSRWRVDGVDDVPGERGAGVWRDLELYWDDHVVRNPVIWDRLAIERTNQQCLRRALQFAVPEVVSLWHMGALSMGLLTTLAETGLPLVYAVGDDWLTYGPKMDAWARIFLDRPRLGRLVRHLTGVPTNLGDIGQTGTFCFVSDCTRRRAEALGRWRFPGAEVVPHGINPADFPIADPLPPERAWQWRLLYVGRIDDRKGIDTAIRALARLPEEATLTLVGRGDDRYRARLQELAASLGVAHQLSFDLSSRAELGAFYREADTLIFPSTWEEPFGLVPLEAMACATPVVATGTGGSGEFLTHEVNCLRFTPGDEESLAQAVARQAGDPELRRRLVGSGLETASALTTVRLADELEDRLVAAANGTPRHLDSEPRGSDRGTSPG